jgi:hypothetical protein
VLIPEKGESVASSSFSKAIGQFWMLTAGVIPFVLMALGRPNAITIMTGSVIAMIRFMIARQTNFSVLFRALLCAFLTLVWLTTWKNVYGPESIPFGY